MNLSKNLFRMNLTRACENDELDFVKMLVDNDDKIKMIFQDSLLMSNIKIMEYLIKHDILTSIQELNVRIQNNDMKNIERIYEDLQIGDVSLDHITSAIHRNNLEMIKLLWPKYDRITYKEPFTNNEYSFLCTAIYNFSGGDHEEIDFEIIKFFISCGEKLDENMIKYFIENDMYTTKLLIDEYPEHLEFIKEYINNELLQCLEHDYSDQALYLCKMCNVIDMPLTPVMIYFIKKQLSHLEEQSHSELIDAQISVLTEFLKNNSV